MLIISELVLTPDSPVIGWSVEKMEATYDLSIIRCQHGDSVVLHPRPEVILEPGDRLLLLASLEAVRKLSARTIGF